MKKVIMLKLIIFVLTITIFSCSNTNQKHIGEWESSNSGEKLNLILNEEDLAVMVVGNQVIGGDNYEIEGYKTTLKYEIDYSKDPRLEVSSILSPAYFSFGPGVLWRKSENIRINIAPATSRFIFVSKPFSGMYGVPEGKRSIYGIGLNMSAYLKFNLIENVSVENIIALYSDYTDNPQNIDVNHQVNFEVDVNKYLSVNLTLHLKSDTNASSKIQFRQLFGLGVNYTFHKI